MQPPVFADLHRLTDNERFDKIGAAAENSLVGVALEANQPAKIQRYIDCIIERWPNVRLIDRHNGLTAGTILLRFGPKATQ